MHFPKWDRGSSMAVEIRLSQVARGRRLDLVSEEHASSKGWKLYSLTYVPRYFVRFIRVRSIICWAGAGKIYVDAADPSHFITAGQAYHKVRQIVKGLRSRGLKPGDCVVIHSFNDVGNRIVYPLLWFGVIGAGGHVAGSNPAYHSLEVTHHLKITQAKFIITQTEFLEVIRTAAAESGIPDSRIFTLSSSIANDGGQEKNGYQSWEVLCQDGEEHWKSFNDEARAKETIAALGSTSGTTGLPKAAILPHKHFVSQNAMIATSNGNRPYEVTQLICLPIFHAFTAQVALIKPLRSGQTTYYMPRFYLDSCLSFVKKYNVTDLAVVPPIITAFNSLPNSKQPSLQSLRYILCAGAPLDPKVQSKLYEKLAAEAVIGQVWGVTETAWITSFAWDERDESGSVGRLLPSTELKILDDDGNAITADGVHGEAYVRSPSMFNGYLNNAEANRDAFRPHYETHKLARSPPESSDVCRETRATEEDCVEKPVAIEEKLHKQQASSSSNSKRSFDEMRENGTCPDKALYPGEPAHKRQASDSSDGNEEPTKFTPLHPLSNGLAHSELPSPNRRLPAKPHRTPAIASSSPSSLSKVRSDDPQSITQGASADTWYRTGDIVYVSDGRVFVSGRCKEIIKVRGWQVSPSELEVILIAHPGVADVAVKGIEIKGKEEVPRAYVVPADTEDGKALKEEDVKRFLAEKVVGFKKLAGGVKFIEKIPRNPTGKILRRLLKD
ncbi:MAG: hypothetical protein Q9160_007818 [Pyrenula sp. 1 TL-2023]